MAEDVQGPGTGSGAGKIRPRRLRAGDKGKEGTVWIGTSNPLDVNAESITWYPNRLLLPFADFLFFSHATAVRVKSPLPDCLRICAPRAGPSAGGAPLSSRGDDLARQARLDLAVQEVEQHEHPLGIRHGVEPADELGEGPLDHPHEIAGLEVAGAGGVE